MRLSGVQGRPRSRALVCARGTSSLGFLLRANLLDKVGDQSGPAGLVGCAAAAAVVAVEILVEQNVVLEMGIDLKLFVGAKNRAPSVRTPQKNPEDPTTQLVGNFIETHHGPGSGRAFERKPIPIKLIEAAEILDQQIIDRHPNRPPPIRVTAEQRTVRFSRLVSDAIMHPVAFEVIGLIEVGT